MELGFNKDDVIEALFIFDGDVQRAIAGLLSQKESSEEEKEEQLNKRVKLDPIQGQGEFTSASRMIQNQE